jgi:hypothetical protein
MAVPNVLCAIWRPADFSTERGILGKGFIQIFPIEVPTMVIHAVYENGVFRPTEPVDLPENYQVKVVVDVANATGSPTSPTSPLARLAAMATEYPANPNLPADLAQQHDHYLYGAPKRP